MPPPNVIEKQKPQMVPGAAKPPAVPVAPAENQGDTPPAPPNLSIPMGDLSPYEQQAAKFLSFHGWTRERIERGVSFWRTPPCDETPKRVKALTLPSVGGGEEDIFQMQGAPIPWVHPVEEAIQIQLGRMKVA